MKLSPEASIPRRITLTILVCVSLFIFVCLYSITKIQFLNSELVLVSHVFQPALSELTSIKTKILNNMEYLENITDQLKNPYLLYGQKTLREEIEKFQNDLKGELSTLDKIIKSAGLTEGDQKKFDLFFEDVQKYFKLQVHILEHLQKPQLQSLKQDQDTLYLEKFKWRQNTAALISLLSATMASKTYDTQKQTNETAHRLYLSLLLLCVISLILIFYTYKTLKPIRSLTEKVKNAYSNIQQQNIHLEFLSQYYENILNSVHLGIIVTDEKKELSSFNKYAESEFHLKQGFRNQNLDKINELKPLEVWQAQVKEVLGSQKVQTLENFQFQNKKFDIFIFPLMWDGEKLHGSVSIFEDVTEKVFVKEKLIQSERLATIGRMSTQIAHEIKNPLNSIQLNIEYLQEKCKTTELRDDKVFNSLLSQIFRLKRITDSYLKFSKMPKVEKKMLEVNKVLKDLCDFYKDKNITIYEDYENSLPVIKADALQLRQAFLNILKNASEAMPTGGKIKVVTEYDKNKKMIEVSFADEGEGLKEEEKDKIYLPFYTTKAQGSGLGLSLTQQIIHEHGGSVMCYPNQPRGSVFKGRLPQA